MLGNILAIIEAIGIKRKYKYIAMNADEKHIYENILTDFSKVSIKYLKIYGSKTQNTVDVLNTTISFTTSIKISDLILKLSLQ